MTDFSRVTYATRHQANGGHQKTKLPTVIDRRYKLMDFL